MLVFVYLFILTGQATSRPRLNMAYLLQCDDELEIYSDKKRHFLKLQAHLYENESN